MNGEEKSSEFCGLGSQSFGSTGVNICKMTDVLPMLRSLLNLKPSIKQQEYITCLNPIRVACIFFSDYSRIELSNNCSATCKDTLSLVKNIELHSCTRVIYKPFLLMDVFLFKALHMDLK